MVVGLRDTTALPSFAHSVIDIKGHGPRPTRHSMKGTIMGFSAYKHGRRRHRRHGSGGSTGTSTGTGTNTGTSTGTNTGGH